MNSEIYVFAALRLRQLVKDLPLCPKKIFSRRGFVKKKVASNVRNPTFTYYGLKCF
jgi:hypothetical protein